MIIIYDNSYHYYCYYYLVCAIHVHQQLLDLFRVQPKHIAPFAFGNLLARATPTVNTLALLSEY